MPKTTLLLTDVFNLISKSVYLYLKGTWFEYGPEFQLRSLILSLFSTVPPNTAKF